MSEESSPRPFDTEAFEEAFNKGPAIIRRKQFDVERNGISFSIKVKVVRPFTHYGFDYTSAKFYELSPKELKEQLDPPGTDDPGVCGFLTQFEWTSGNNCNLEYVISQTGARIYLAGSLKEAGYDESKIIQVIKEGNFSLPKTGDDRPVSFYVNSNHSLEANGHEDNFQLYSPDIVNEYDISKPDKNRYENMLQAINVPVSLMASKLLDIEPGIDNVHIAFYGTKDGVVQY